MSSAQARRLAALEASATAQTVDPDYTPEQPLLQYFRHGLLAFDGPNHVDVIAIRDTPTQDYAKTAALVNELLADAPGPQILMLDDELRDACRAFDEGRFLKSKDTWGPVYLKCGGLASTNLQSATATALRNWKAQTGEDISTVGKCAAIVRGWLADASD